MDDPKPAANPRLAVLRQEVEQRILKPFRSHGWSATIVREIDRQDCIEITAEQGHVKSHLAVLYSSSGISNAQYKELARRVDHIFFSGQPYQLEIFARDVPVPVEPLGDFFPLLVTLNKRIEPDRSLPTKFQKAPKSRRLTDENPLEAVIARLQQFTSVKLASKLVERRASESGISVPVHTIGEKAIGVAYSLRSALEYFSSTSNETLNKRVISLYYGTMAFAQAEMLASASGPTDLDEVEGMTKLGHGLYTLPIPGGGFAEFRVGVLARGFLPQWVSFLGGDPSEYPRAKARSRADLDKMPPETVCSLRDLFASMPEVDDLFGLVLGGPPGWVSAAFDNDANLNLSALNATGRKVRSTYVRFIDRSGRVSLDSLNRAGWPIAEIALAGDYSGPGIAFRARVDHSGHEYWWGALPIHSSSFGQRSTLLFPTVGGVREYRIIAAITLYALSIMARYMPSAWRRIEGGDEDEYLALVKTALSVWTRVLPEQFLETIAGERVYTAQPGSFFG